MSRPVLEDLRCLIHVVITTHHTDQSCPVTHEFATIRSTCPDTVINREPIYDPKSALPSHDITPARVVAEVANAHAAARISGLIRRIAFFEDLECSDIRLEGVQTPQESDKPLKRVSLIAPWANSTLLTAQNFQ